MSRTGPSLRCRVVAALVLGVGAGCNAVLGLEATELGATGAGGQASTSTAATPVTSSTSSTAGAGGGGGGATTSSSAGGGGATGGSGGEGGAGTSSGTGDGGGGGAPLPNLLANGSFEDGVDFWTTAGPATIASVDDVDAVEGGKVLRATSTGLDTLADVYTQRAIGISEGCLRLSVFARHDQGELVADLFMQLDGLAFADVAIAPGSTFERFEVRCAVGNPLATVRAGVGVETPSGGDLAVLSIDDARLEVVECVGGEVSCDTGV